MTPTPPKPPALGRGLAALFPGNAQTGTAAKSPGGVLQAPIEEIVPMPGQPRTMFSLKELGELADSIREKGVLQPILVRKVEQGYQLITGERRWRAAQQAGLSTIPVLIKDVDEAEAFQLALIENLQREDLNPVEVGKAFRKLLDDYKLTQEEVSTRVGKDRATVSNYIRILKLPPVILSRVEDGTLSFGHARTLASAPSGIFSRVDTAALVSGKFSVRELERIVAKLKEESEGKKGTALRERAESPQVRFIRRQLERKLGLKVRLTDQGGKGRLVIEYTSLDELEGVLDLLGIRESD